MTRLPSRRSEPQDATVMFADISGFTALSEQLDPEEVTDVMNRCFERLESVVFARGGIVDEYLGDCVKAVFGFSPTNTNPTLHAVHAALEIRAVLAEFNREQRLPAPLPRWRHSTRHSVAPSPSSPTTCCRSSRG